MPAQNSALKTLCVFYQNKDCRSKNPKWELSHQTTLIFPLLLPEVVGPWDSAVNHRCISRRYRILLTDQDSPWVL